MYYLGTLYWSKNRMKRARELFEAASDAPDFAPFYGARAELQDALEEDASESVAADLQRAIQLDSDQWRAWRLLITHHSDRDAHGEALRVSRRAYDRFPDNYYVGLEHAAMLLKNGHYAESARVLDEAQVLPHDLFEQTHMLLALERMKSNDYAAALDPLERSKSWPEHLGVGKPFNPDRRLQDYLEAYAYRQRGNERRATEHLEAVATYTTEHRMEWGIISAPLRSGNSVKKRRPGSSSTIGKMQRCLRRRWCSGWALASFHGDEQSAQKHARTLDARKSETSEYGLLRAFSSEEDGLIPAEGNSDAGRSSSPGRPLIGASGREPNLRVRTSRSCVER